MDEAEVEAFLAEGHTAILATLRADGSPAVMPLWYVVVDGSPFVRTLAGSKKVAHVRRDPRVSFMVESGRAWAQLKTVVIHGTAVIEADAAITDAVDDAFATKYADYVMPAATGEKTRMHYAQERAHIRIVPAPEGRLLTWDNAKIVPKV